MCLCQHGLKLTQSDPLTAWPARRSGGGSGERHGALGTGAGAAGLPGRGGSAEGPVQAGLVVGEALLGGQAGKRALDLNQTVLLHNLLSQVALWC